jgi:hypothetical protein
MVWRKVAGDHPPAAAAAQPPGINVTPSVTDGGRHTTMYRVPAPASQAAQAEPEAPAQTEAEGLDLEQITEHVSRVILRRIAVERERRGVQR